MSAPPYMKRGATRRLEIHQGNFALSSWTLTAGEIGELLEMLMAEVAGQPVPQTANAVVGGDQLTNLAAACEGCNRRKGAKLLSEWRASH